MHLLNLTLDSPAANLALDEALLEEAEAGNEPRETLRLWESPRPMVVVGRSSQLETEVNLAACQARDIPVLRRTSGGCAILAGPGCLMYAVVLSYELRPAARSLDEAHALVLETILNGLRPLLAGLSRQGTSDLALGEAKFSGNSLRVKRRHFLYHGTLLYDFELPLVAECLRMPPKQPEYRRGREHAAFVTNLSLSAAQLRTALISAWRATDEAQGWPRALVEKLVTERYARDAWNRQR